MVLMDKSLLILDDDAPLRGRLRRAMEVRGFEVMDAGTVRDGINIVRNKPPAFAILDMKLEDGTGLTLVQELRKKRVDCRIVMLTGFGNIATAVAAVKAGALDYLPKPAEIEGLNAFEIRILPLTFLVGSTILFVMFVLALNRYEQETIEAENTSD